jgi:hypothetical protein
MPSAQETKKKRWRSPINQFVKKIRDSSPYKWANDLSLLAWLAKAVPSAAWGVVEALMHMPPLEILRDVAALFGGTAIVFAIIKEKTAKKRWGVLIVLLAMTLVISATWWLSGIKVYPRFAEAADIYKPKLGEPLSAPVAIRRVAVQRYDNDTHVWLEQGNKSWFLLPNGTFITYEFANLCTRPGIYDSSELTKMFPDVPSGKLPPYGGAACELLDDPQGWKGLLEWMQWQCLYNDRSVVEQRFAKGVIIGEVNTAPSVTTKGVVFVIFNDGTWTQSEVYSSPPPCKASMKENEQ